MSNQKTSYKPLKKALEAGFFPGEVFTYLDLFKVHKSEWETEEEKEEIEGVILSFLETWLFSVHKLFVDLEIHELELPDCFTWTVLDFGTKESWKDTNEKVVILTRKEAKEGGVLKAIEILEKKKLKWLR